MIPEQDFERLSAYLDNELSAAETARLESQLAQDAALTAALTDLRRQTRALQALPRLKPPRNFTLTAEQARTLRPARRPFFETLFPALRLATSLSAAAFAVVLAAAVLGPTPAALPQLASAPAAKEAAGAAGPAEVPAAAALAPEGTPAADSQLRTMQTLTETGLAAGAAVSVESANGVTEAYSLGAQPPAAAPLPAAAAPAADEGNPAPLLWPAAGVLGVVTALLAAGAWLVRQR